MDKEAYFAHVLALHTAVKSLGVLGEFFCFGKTALLTCAGNAGTWSDNSVLATNVKNFADDRGSVLGVLKVMSHEGARACALSLSLSSLKLRRACAKTVGSSWSHQHHQASPFFSLARRRAH